MLIQKYQNKKMENGINIQQELLNNARDIATFSGKIDGVHSKVDLLSSSFVQFLVEYKDDKSKLEKERKDWHEKMENQVKNITDTRLAVTEFNKFKFEVDSKLTNFDNNQKTSMQPIIEFLEQKKNTETQISGVTNLFNYLKTFFVWFSGIFIFLTSATFLRYSSGIIDFLSKLK